MCAMVLGVCASARKIGSRLAVSDEAPIPSPSPKRPLLLHTRQRSEMLRDRWRRFGRSLVRGEFNRGYCPICEKKTLFVRNNPWLRDHYFCVRCLSIPRFRALIYVLHRLFPDWRRMSIHESSPGSASSNKLARECAQYLGTQFFPGVPSGSIYRDWRCENLESLTFDDESHDLVITQDVLEHVPRPDLALAEIARTLKPGGAHVFTVPIFAGRQTFVRAVPGPRGIEYLCEPDYHGNPVDKNGSLVIREWGEDLPEYIHRHSGLYTTVYLIRDRRLGLDGEFLEVCVSRKAAASPSNRPSDCFS